MSQTDKLYQLLQDYQPHRTDQIARLVYQEKGQICLHCGRGEMKSLARIGARIFDIKRKYGVVIEGRRDKQIPSLYWYQMRRPSMPSLSVE